MKHAATGKIVLGLLGLVASACTSTEPADATLAQQPGVYEYSSSRLPGGVQERGTDCYYTPSPGCDRHAPAY